MGLYQGSGGVQGSPGIPTDADKKGKPFYGAVKPDVPAATVDFSGYAADDPLFCDFNAFTHMNCSDCPQRLTINLKGGKTATYLVLPGGTFSGEFNREDIVGFTVEVIADLDAQVATATAADAIQTDCLLDISTATATAAPIEEYPFFVTLHNA